MTKWIAVIGYWYRDEAGRSQTKELFIEPIEADDHDSAAAIALDRLIPYQGYSQHCLEVLLLTCEENAVLEIAA